MTKFTQNLQTPVWSPPLRCSIQRGIVESKIKIIVCVRGHPKRFLQIFLQLNLIQTALPEHSQRKFNAPTGYIESWSKSIIGFNICSTFFYNQKFPLIEMLILISNRVYQCHASSLCWSTLNWIKLNWFFDEANSGFPNTLVCVSTRNVSCTFDLVDKLFMSASMLEVFTLIPWANFVLEKL